SIRNDITHGSLPFLGVCDRSGPWHMVNVAMPTSERAVYVRELAPAGEPTLLTTSDTYPCCIDRQCDYFLAKLCALADDMWAALAAGFSNDELPAPRGT
ncbi:MAG TPA: hypothetical protein QGH10_14680, partial [Armatimonadota bacterium]|nr:hypothetical protein [Armatimonadota bacterium]